LFSEAPFESQTLFQAPQLDVHNAGPFTFVEALENDGVVHAIQEFRVKE
jgi:hypothetical protein